MAMKCWICGAVADSGEHRIKASDIRSVFGSVSQSKPLFLHRERRFNRPIKGIKADILKSRARICSTCNNQRTQAHDRAWERLSRYLRSREPLLQVGDRIRLHKVFPGCVQRSMLGVHLYFVKVFGCLIAEYSVPIDLAPFSQAIMQESSHPNMYLAFCYPMSMEFRAVGHSNLDVAKLNGRIISAAWFYNLDRISVRVMYVGVTQFKI